MSASLSLSYLSRNWLICMLVLFLVSHRSLGLSSLFFKNYFSFFCFNQVISKLSFSNLHTCFLFDFFCWWRLSFCIFHFIHGILQLQNFFWFFFMTLLCLSLISSNCHLVLFYISLNFLRRAIWIVCLCIWLWIKPLCLWSFLSKVYIDLLAVLCMFSWLLMFFRILQCCLYNWSSSHLFQSLLTAFRWEVPSISPASDSDAFFVAVQSLSRVQLSATTWTSAHQGSLSFCISMSFPKLLSIKSVMPSNISSLSFHSSLALNLS